MNKIKKSSPGFYKVNGKKVPDLMINLYQKGGLYAYNPYLAKDDMQFQKWYATNTLEGKNDIAFSEDLDYDYYSYYRNGGYKNKKSNHFPDTYKKPNHETFSEDSIYSTPENKGGKWVNGKYIKQNGGLALPTLEDWQRMNPPINPVQTPTTDSWYAQRPDMANYSPMNNQGPDQYKRQFDFTQPNGWGLGLMGAFIGSQALLNKSNDRNYEAYKRRWVRDYNIPSLLQDPNKFSSTMYESPIYQTGGGVPTTQDSLALYANSMALRNFYGSRKDYKLDKVSPVSEDVHKTHDDNYKKFLNTIAIEGSRTNESGGYMIVPTYRYRQNIDSNKYRQRENAAIVLNLAAPMGLYDRRISPTLQYMYSNTSDEGRLAGDNVDFFGYDPLQVKPWHMLTNKEKEIRLKKYGPTPGADIFELGEMRGTPEKPKEIRKSERPPNDPGLTRPDKITNDTRVMPNVNITGNPQQQIPGAYSFTYPTFDGNVQNTISTPDRDAWKKYLQGVRGMSSQERDKSGTATGYVGMQKGGVAPYYTNNPNDPRLRAYVDSMILHKATKNSIDFIKTMSPEQWAEYVREWNKKNPQAETAFKRLNRPEPIKTYSPREGNVAVEYARPVQDVILETSNSPDLVRPDRVTTNNVNSSTPVDIQGMPIAIQQNGNYRFTFPTFDKDVQRTISTSDRNAWKKFVEDRRLASSQEDSNSGTATGYLNYQTGGMTMNTPEDQGMGYYKYPSASSLTFPGSGQRTFIPGPFPLLVKDSKGTQIMTNKPVKTKGKVVEIPIFEQGGEIRKVAPTVDKKDATIEAQKGEVIFGAGAPGNVEDQKDRVGVGLYKIGGKLHSQGGTPLKAYPGDFVFSNETSLAPSEEDAKLLVGKEIKKIKKRTPAELAKRYLDLNKFIDMAQDEDLDPITKKTSILNINNYINRLAEIAYAQEEKKSFSDGVPEFVKLSMQTRFDEQGLQEELNQYKYGGQVKKLPSYQTRGLVTDDMWDQAQRVKKPTVGAQFMGNRGWNSLYQLPGSGAATVNKAIPGGTPGKPWENWLINQLQSGVTIDELVKKGHGTPEGLSRYQQYYKPGSSNRYEMTSDPFKTPRMYDYPNLDQLTPSFPNRPMTPINSNTGVPDNPTTDTFTEIPNQQFNVNLAEATNLLAAWMPSESRYPPAFRNYEIQNAKAQIASTGRPISEQPYLNAINRSQLGFDQNNNPYGAAGATRSLGAFQASLGAQNQAISQVYNQNIARADQRASQLAQLEVQDGVDRITNAENYDNKLEMLANNRELERKDRLRNTSNIFNQMVSDREQKRLFNTMSEWYQINPDGGIGMKPTYKIENGKLVPVQRNVRDLIRSQPSTTSQYHPAIQLAERLQQMGYSREDITRILSRSVDDYDKPNQRR